MPKLIPDLRNRILTSARSQLIQFGFEGLSLRRVATDCSIAVGTTYNYFPSKSDLALDVLKSDWQKVLHEIKEETDTSSDVVQAILYIYRKIHVFSDNYHHIFTKLHTESLADNPEIITDTQSILSHILTRFGYHEKDSCLNFETKLLLTAISFSDTSENDFVTVLQRQFRS